MIGNYIRDIDIGYGEKLRKILDIEKKLDDTRWWIMDLKNDKKLGGEMSEDLYKLDSDFSKVLRGINETMVKANDLYRKYNKYVEEYRKVNKGRPKK